jgi:hypothetical protein
MRWAPDLVGSGLATLAFFGLLFAGHNPTPRETQEKREYRRKERRKPRGKPI